MTLQGSYLLAFVIVVILMPIYMKLGANLPQSITLGCYTAMTIVLPLIIWYKPKNEE